MKGVSLQGTKTPPATQDASRKLPTSKTTVNAGVRSATAATDKTIGPRCA